MTIWLALFATALGATTPCNCPAQASLPTLIAAAHGFVVCGYQDAREGDVYTINEYQVFECGGSEAIASGGALDEARLEIQPNELVLTQTTRWPAGEGWAWIGIPYMRITLESVGRPPSQEVLATRKHLSEAEVRDLTALYADVVRQGAFETSGEDIEKLIGRLVVGCIARDPVITELFRSLPNEYSLDGHAAEMYSEGNQFLSEIGLQPETEAPHN